MDELIALHRESLADFDRLVGLLEPDDLARPTPCTGWSVADLLAHSVGQHRGFARAVRTGDAPAEAYEAVPWSRAAWRESVDDLLDAFGGADPSGVAHQVELRPGQPIPVRFIVGAQLLDSAVHAWDLAAALGRTYRPNSAIVDAVVGGARLIPDGETRSAGGPFARALSDDTGDPWIEALRLVGRDERWARA
jgi:uncharacterized protein (TIGR03086 family)